MGKTEGGAGGGDPRIIKSLTNVIRTDIFWRTESNNSLNFFKSLRNQL